MLLLLLPALPAAAPQPSVEAAVAAHPGRFVVANTRWTGGTEQMLDAVAAFFAELAGAAGGGDGSGAAKQQEQGQQEQPTCV
jgi:hypothetical protein